MFLAQTTLEAWLDSGKADFDGSTVTLSSHQKSYALQPAVRFEALIEGEGMSLLGKVLTEAQIRQLGGELMEDSVMFGDHAFTVLAGYIAVLRERDGG